MKQNAVNMLSAVMGEKKTVVAIPPRVKKMCLSSSHETGLAIADQQHKGVRRVCRAAAACLQLRGHIDSRVLCFSAG